MRYIPCAKDSYQCQIQAGILKYSVNYFEKEKVKNFSSDISTADNFCDQK